MIYPARDKQRADRLTDRLIRLLMVVIERLMQPFIRVSFHRPLPALAKTEGQYCYALGNKSLTDRILLSRITRQYGLPWSEQGSETVSKDARLIALHMNHYGLKGLAEHRVSPRLTRMMAHLLEHPEQDIKLVPVTIFWGRSPGQERHWLNRFSDQRGWLHQSIKRLGAIIFHGRHTLVHFAEPVSLRALIATSPESTLISQHVRKTARLLRVHFRQTRISVTGPELPDRKQLIRQLIRSPRIQSAVQSAVKEQGVSSQKARQKAEKYADEIVANVSYSTVKLFDILLSWLWNRLYQGVNIHNIEQVQESAKNNTLVYVPCHRSHMDYLLLSYALYNQGLTPPHVAAGINLNLPIVGSLLRRGGAFFIRRSFRDNPLYAAVFSEYLFMLLNKGYATEYFIEGGRSRTGRTLVPKPGMLSMTIQGYLRNPHRHIQLIPVYIGYEKVVEGRTYLGELRGKEKKGESIIGLIRSLKTLKEHFGKVNLAFGQPIDLKHTLDATIPHWDNDQLEGKPDWLPQAVQTLSQQVAVGINSTATLNAANLTALGLLTAPSFTLEESSLNQFIQLCQTLHNRLQYSGHAPINTQTPEQLIAEAEKLQLITRLNHHYGDLLQLNEQQALLMTWYRNNILHLFALPSLIAFCFNQNSQQSPIQLHELLQVLYPLIAKELFLPWDKSGMHQHVDNLLQQLIEQGVLTDNGEQLARVDPYQDKGVLLTLLARPIQPSLERGYLMIALLRHHGSGSFTTETLEAECQILAQRLSILHGLNAPEYFHKPLFKQLSELLLEQGYLWLEDGHLHFSQALETFSVQCRPLFDPALRHSIRQLASQPKAQSLS